MTGPAPIPPVSAPLPWQAGEWAQLAQQIDGDQLPHALLLAGPEHIGKGALALALARLLLCARPTGGLNCGSCHPCELSASGSHGDLRWLEPEEKSRVIKIDQIRGVVEFSSRTAGFGLRKVVVLAPAESMNANAANALLKVLEEPAANTYILLVCHRLHGLPATIRSRCQLLRLPLPAAEQSLPWLDQVTGARAQSGQLLDLARGRPLLAEQLDQDSSGERLALVRAAMAGLIAGRSGAAELAGALADDSLDNTLAQLVDGIQDLLRQLDGAQLTSRPARAAFGLIDEIRGLQRASNAGSNPNRQILLDALLAKLQRELGGGGLGDNIRMKQGGPDR